MGVRPVSQPGVELEPVFNRIGKATQGLRHLGGSLLMQASGGLSLRLGPGQSVSSQDLGLCRELCASDPSVVAGGVLCRELCASGPGMVAGLEHVSGLLESRVGCPLWGGRLDCARQGMWAEHTRHAVPGMEESGSGVTACVCGEGRPPPQCVPLAWFSLALGSSPCFLLLNSVGSFYKLLNNMKESRFHCRMCD